MTWAHDLILANARGRLPEHILANGGEAGVHEALLVAQRNGVGGWLASALRGHPEVTPSLRIQLAATCARVAGNHRRGSAFAAEVLRTLSTEEIPAIAVKGAWLVERYWRDPTHRSYTDLDLVVPPARLRDAVRALEDVGFGLLDAHWPLVTGDLRGQLHLHKDGQALDLHWHLLNDRRKRSTLRFGSAEMWDSARASSLAGEPCLTLPPGDEAAYVALHAAFHGCHRFLWLLDLAKIAADPEMDWDRTARRLERWRFATGGYLVFALARAWAGADVPLAELRSLRPKALTRAAFRRLVSRWDLSQEPVRSRQLFFATAGDGVITRSRLAYEVLVPAPAWYRAETGPGPLLNLRRLTVGTVGRIRHKLDDEEDHSGREYEPMGDPKEGRERYFAAVEAAASAQG
jgi:putative nucleotidyltransferase-like protein